MRLVFAGTPEFAVPTLERLLHSDHEVIAVYTQPDRPAGRGRKVTASPIKILAEKFHTPVLQPQTLRNESVIAGLRSLEPDIMVVVAYGLILPQSVLSIPATGCLNVHASLLPRWRGAAPIQRAILAGDQQSGVTIMQMDAGLDTGDMLKQSAVPITTEMTAQELHDELATIGAEDLLQVIDQIANGTPPNPCKQDEGSATYAAKLSKKEADIDWNQANLSVLRKIKAFNPWPVAQTILHGRLLRIWDAELTHQAHTSEPGTLLSTSGGKMIIACGEGSIALSEVQAEGKKRMTSLAYLNARKEDTRPGLVFGR